jgi:hypothetical protein
LLTYDHKKEFGDLLFDYDGISLTPATLDLSCLANTQIQAMPERMKRLLIKWGDQMIFPKARSLSSARPPSRILTSRVDTNKRRSSIIRRDTMKIFLVSLVWLSLLAAGAYGQANDWVNGKWNGPNYQMELSVKGNDVTGQAQVKQGSKVTARPSITGTVDGDTLTLDFYYASTANHVPVVLVRDGKTLTKKSGKISDSTFNKAE